MQVDCYKLNYGADICSGKCRFRPECDRKSGAGIHNQVVHERLQAAIRGLERLQRNLYGRR